MDRPCLPPLTALRVRAGLEREVSGIYPMSMSAPTDRIGWLLSAFGLSVLLRDVAVRAIGQH